MSRNELRDLVTEPRCVEELLDVIREIQESRALHIREYLLTTYGGWNSLVAWQGRPIENVVDSL